MSMGIRGSTGSARMMQQMQLMSMIQKAGTAAHKSESGAVAHGVSEVGEVSHFASALMRTLAQMGVPGAVPATTDTSLPASPTANDASSSTRAPQQVLSTFLQDLFASLRAQEGMQSSPTGSPPGAPAGDGGRASGVASTYASGSQHPDIGGGLSHIETGLQALIQQLTASASATSGTAASGNMGAAGAETATLQQDYQNLLSSLGASGNQASLGSFLQSIAMNLQDGSPGMMVSAKA